MVSTTPTTAVSGVEAVVDRSVRLAVAHTHGRRPLRFNSMFVLDQTNMTGQVLSTWILGIQPSRARPPESDP